MPEVFANAASNYSIEDMYEYSRDILPTCRAFATDNDIASLFNLFAKTPDLRDKPIESNIITENKYEYPCVEINRSYKYEGYARWDRYKVVLFSDVSELLKESPNIPAIVGFIQFSFGDINCLVPIGITTTNSTVVLGDTFARNKDHPTPYVLYGNIENTAKQMIICMTALWGVIELAPTDPSMGELVVITKTKKITTCKLNSAKIQEKLRSLSD